MESKALRPDADHSPTIEKDDGECNDIKHGLSAKVISTLDEPESVNTGCLLLISGTLAMILTGTTPTCAAIPTIKRYVSCRVLYETMLFWSVPITVTVVFRESPRRK